MPNKELLKLIKGDPSEVKNLLREVVREENERLEIKKQTTCTHAISATLVDVKAGIVRCDECGLIFGLKTEQPFKHDSANTKQLPPLMQKQINALKRRKADAD